MKMAATFFRVSLIIAFLFFPRGDSLSCYKCTSEHSWNDCNTKMTKTTCSSELSKCLQGTMNCTSGDRNATIYYKSCSDPNEDCEIAIEDLPHCPKSIPSWKFSHKENCCSGDDCNGNSGSSHSTTAPVSPSQAHSTTISDLESTESPYSPKKRARSHSLALSVNKVLLGMNMALILSAV